LWLVPPEFFSFQTHTQTHTWEGSI
jgi:hypothetical protein